MSGKDIDKKKSVGAIKDFPWPGGRPEIIKKIPLEDLAKKITEALNNARLEMAKSYHVVDVARVGEREMKIASSLDIDYVEVNLEVGLEGIDENKRLITDLSDEAVRKINLKLVLKPKEFRIV